MGSVLVTLDALRRGVRGRTEVSGQTTAQTLTQTLTLTLTLILTEVGGQTTA